MVSLINWKNLQKALFLGHNAMSINKYYIKTYVKRPLSKRPKFGFQDQLSLNAGQKYCRMLQGEHSAILSTFIKLPIVIKIFVLSIFERPFYTDFTWLKSVLLGIPLGELYALLKILLGWKGLRL